MEESLIKRLAGPSTGKAGLTKDQTEINRIIAEASKGSQFYENERRKDQELTEKIQKLLKHRDDLLKNANVDKLNVHLDKTINDLETERDLSQYIVHADMDAFFAAVELLDNPKLKGKPFGVGKGVLTTASYDARQYGVRSGMPGFIAKKLCPHIILVPIRTGRYSEASKSVMNILRQYDPDMLAAGADEAFLNITKYCDDHSITPDECVQKLRAHVFKETNLTVSAGIAPNKMLAKICSDKNKPNGQFHLPFDRDAILSFMRDLPIRKIPGIGRVTERLLDAVGIKTCGDIYTHRTVIFLLDKQFSSQSLFQTYLGLGSNKVQPTQRNERRSVGSERTFSPISDLQLILQRLEQCAEDLEGDLKDKGWAGQTVTLKYKLDTYQVFTRAKSSAKFVCTKAELLAIGKSLLAPELPLCIRLIGLRVTKLKDLRMPEDHGLKRFFQPLASPSKKLRYDEDEDFQKETETTLEEEQAMAEYEDEFNQESNMASQAAADEAEDSGVDATATPATMLTHLPIKPEENSENLSAEHRTPPIGKPLSSAKKRTRDDVKKDESLTCPICHTSLLMDNAGLNQHVDFCLSKETIMAATAMKTETEKKRKL